MAELIIVTKYQGGAGRALGIRGNREEREDVRRNVPIHDATLPHDDKLVELVKEKVNDRI